MSLPREFFGPFVDLSPGMIVFEHCESLFAHPKNEKTAARKFAARHFFGIQQLSGTAGLGDAF